MTACINVNFMLHKTRMQCRRGVQPGVQIPEMHRTLAAKKRKSNPMNRQVLIKSFNGSDLSLEFFNVKGCERGLNGKWGSMNIGIKFMHEDDEGARRPEWVSMELDHADIGVLISELQKAKEMLAC